MSARQACPGIVTFFINPLGMQKYCLILFQMAGDNMYDITRTHQARFAITNSSVVLVLFLIEPTVHEGKVLATMINLTVVKTSRLSILEDSDVLVAPVSNPCQILTQVDGRI